MVVQRRTSRDIRNESRLDVLHTVLSARETTRNEIVRATGLSPATVATVVGELLAQGIVAETKVRPGRSGRPTATLGMNAARGFIIGIDVAETYVRAVLFDTALNQLAFADGDGGERVPDADAVVEGIGRLVDKLLEEQGISRSDVLGVGVSLPGLVQGPSGPSVIVPLWAWQNVETERLRERLALPLAIDNPLKASATAELWLGRGRYRSSLATVNLGTGVGAGIALEGRILRGATNSAGEWGHSLLVLDGRLCRCGRKGCVEAYVGAPGIQQTLRDIDPTHPLAGVDLQGDFIEAVAAAANSDKTDPVIAETIARTAYYLGSALADLVAIVNPEVVTLTGWTTWALSEHLLPATLRHLREQAPGQSGQDVQVTVSAVRGNSAATGIAIIALERFLADAGLLTTNVPIAL
ncbi:ROK family transcriptional regulator [Devosia aquimaris]|uniref:ROK family transcriptional regulator n=1 Tax=Devosia aquimaris TaxID=2866214 RepID=UPI001CD0FEB5|nr:ROK family transcriptional regulator [Devosia sp. CJK-A8-3]